MIKNHSLQVIAKPIGPICNMDCTYCFYLQKEKLYSQNKANNSNAWIMSDEILETFIKQKLESNDFPEETFVWQGGEPTLLGINYFQKIIDYQRKHNAGKKISNSIQTNGTLLTDDWCEFFAENKILIGLSIDGSREIHDKYRIDKGGRPTFDKVMRGINLLKKYQVEFNTLTTVHRENSIFPLEIYHFLKDIGSKYMQFIPIVERNETSEVSDWSVESIQYGKFLIAVFDEWVRNDVGSVFVQTFDVSLEAWFGQKSSLCIFNDTCGFAPAIEHNGNIYSCDHYVNPENKVGNILENSLHSLMQTPQQQNFGNNKRDTLPRFCRKCNFRFACHGECPKNRFLYTEDGEYGLNYLCAAYKLYFGHIDPYMNFMANELKNRRPAANVMTWIHEKKKNYM